MCEFCEEKFPVVTHYGKFKIDKLSNKPVITCDLNKCPTFAVCSSKDMNVEMVMEIAYCPICGRKLCDETETPIEHFLKSEIERSKLQMNAYAECFDGVHVDNDTRKKLLESHIRFCENALKQCMDV